MNKSRHLHIISHLLAPLDQSGALAPDKLSPLIGIHKPDGPDALLVGAMSMEESEHETDLRKRLFRLVGEQCRAAPSLIADVNAATPDAAASLARIAYEQGFHATSLCLSVATAEGIASGRAFVNAVESAAPIPIYVRIFDRPSVEATLDQFMTLVDVARIAGVLVYCRDSRLLRRLEDHPASSVIYCGLEESLMAHLTFGATGVVSHLANFLSPLFRETQAAVARDDFFRAATLQSLTEGFVRVASGMGVLAASKGWMTLLGVDCGPCHGANGCLTNAEWRSLSQWLEAYVLNETAPSPSISV